MRHSASELTLGVSAILTLTVAMAPACHRETTEGQSADPAPTSSSKPGLVKSIPTVKPFARQGMDARGGAQEVLGMAAVHMEGTISFPGGASADLDAYLDQRSGVPRAMFQFKSGGAARILCYDGTLGFERNESGVYTPATGSALDDIRAVTMAFLVAAQYPLGDHWAENEGSSAIWNDPARNLSTLVKLDAKGLPASARFTNSLDIGSRSRETASTPTSAPPSPHCEYKDWRPSDKVLFPMTLEYFDRGQSAWSLQVSRWDSHAFVVEALYSPPKTVDGPSDGSRPKKS